MTVDPLVDRLKNIITSQLYMYVLRSVDCFRVKSVWRWAIVGRLSADSRPTSYKEKTTLRFGQCCALSGRQTDDRRAFNLSIVGRLSPDCIDCCRRSTDNQPIAAPIKTRPNLPFLYLLDVFFFLRNYKPSIPLFYARCTCVLKPTRHKILNLFGRLSLQQCN